MEIIFICIKVFFARIIDVSLGVLRTISLFKNETLKAVVIAFFEVLIWFVIAKEALVNDFSILIALFYSLGYATGTYIGVKISEYFSKGKSIIQVISNKIDLNKIKKEGFGISSIKMDNNKKMFIIGTNNKRINNVINLIKKIDSNAFIMVNDSKLFINGYIK